MARIAQLREDDSGRSSTLSGC